MIIYSPSITHRLSYIADFVGRQLTGQPASVTDNRDEYISAAAPRVNYSAERVTPDEIWIEPQGLLFETGVREQPTACFEWNGNTTFFKTGGEIPFDLLAAVFYLLSRYEEYLPHQKDMYGRYAHENSLAYREGFLNRPLVNYWLAELSRIIDGKFSRLPPPVSRFTFLPTYDIDEAWSYKHKETTRSTGGAVRDILQGKFDRFVQRRKVLNGMEPDPYDSYAWMDDLHRPYNLQPRYFFLLAAKNGRYDKNILPGQPAMQTLIREIAKKYSIGIHPSWQSGDDHALFQQEKETLERITGLRITASRQHYVRFTLPETFHRLIDAGIREDFSMGYGGINGFRASVASAFYWYDLEKEQTTSLLLYPFCYMEANSFFELKQSPMQALDEMYHYLSEVKKVNGLLCSLGHNTFFGTDPLFEGWREVYEQFFKEAAAYSR